MKIMLDECMTSGVANIVNPFILAGHGVEGAYFLPEYFGEQGLKDAAWPALLCQESDDWCVITADRNRARKNRAKRQVDGPPLH